MPNLDLIRKSLDSYDNTVGHSAAGALRGVSQTQEELATFPGQEKPSGFFDYAYDIGVRGVVGGIERAAGSIYNLFDYADDQLLNLIDPYTPQIAQPRTLIGGLVGGASQLAVGFIPGGLAVKGLTGLSKTAGLTGALSKTAAGAALAGRANLAKGLAIVGKGAVAGAVADFVSFEHDEGRISDLLRGTAFETDLSNWLASDEDDGVLEGRLKNVIEGGLIGIPLDFGIEGIKAYVRSAKRVRAAKRAVDKGESTEEAIKKAYKETPEPKIDPLAPEAQTTWGRKMDERLNSEDDLLSGAATSKLDELRERIGLARTQRAITEAGETAGTSRNKLDELRQDLSKPTTEGDPLNPTRVGEDLDVGTGGDMKVRTRTEDPTFLYLEGLKKQDPNLKKSIYATDGDSGALLMRYLSRKVWEQKPTKAIKKARKKASKEKLAKDDSLLSETIEESVESIEHDANFFRMSGMDIPRLIGNLKEQPHLIDKAAALGRVARNLSESAAEELRPLLRRAWQDPDTFTELEFRELTNVLRNIAGIQEAYKDIWSSLGWNLKAIDSRVRKPRKGSLKWKALEDLENLQAAGFTDVTKKEALEIIQKIDQVLGANPKAGVASVLTWADKTIMQKTGAAVMESWMNSVLSNPATSMLNVISGGVMSFWNPVETLIGARIGGAIGSLDPKVARAIVDRETRVLRNLTQEWGEAWRIAMHTGDAKYYKRTSKFDSDDFETFSSTAAAAKDLGASPKTAKSISSFLGLPSLALGKGDDFWKVLNFRARAKAELYSKAASKGLDPSQTDEWVETSLGLLTNNRADLRTRADLRRMMPELVAENPLNIEQSVLDKLQMEGREVDQFLDTYDNAVLQGEKATFTEALTPERGVIAGVGASLSVVVRNHPMMRLFLPFIRTPANIAQYSWDRTFGTIFELTNSGQVQRAIRQNADNPEVLEGLMESIHKGLMSPDPKIRADMTGRVAMGLSVMGAMGALTPLIIDENDPTPRITGRGPTDKEARRALELAGWQPYSVKIGDKYYSYQKADPIASLLGIVADMNELVAQNADDPEVGTIEGLVIPLVGSIANNITQKTYMQGIENLLGALSGDPREMKSALGSTLSGLVPYSGALGAATREIDPTMREIRSSLDRYMSRFPGASSRLAPRRNILGEKMVKSDVSSLPGVDMFLPTRATRVSDKIVDREIAGMRYAFSTPSIRRGGVVLTDEEFDLGGQDAYDRFMELSGTTRVYGMDLRQSLRKLIASPEYQRISPDHGKDGEPSARKDLINRVLRRHRAAAWTQLQRERPSLSNAVRKARRDEVLRKSGQQPTLFD